MSEWGLEPPMPTADELALNPEVIEKLRAEYEIQCEGAWRDMVREVFTDADAVANLLDDEEGTLWVQVSIPLRKALQALSERGERK